MCHDWKNNNKLVCILCYRVSSFFLFIFASLFSVFFFFIFYFFLVWVHFCYSNDFLYRFELCSTTQRAQNVMRKVSRKKNNRFERVKNKTVFPYSRWLVCIELSKRENFVQKKKQKKPNKRREKKYNKFTNIIYLYCYIFSFMFFQHICRTCIQHSNSRKYIRKYRFTRNYFWAMFGKYIVFLHTNGRS